jgi:uncharacterized membrane protein
MIMQVTKTYRVWLAGCVLAALAVSPALAQYNTIGLGTRSTAVTGVNDSGEIVGTQNSIGTFDDEAFMVKPKSFPFLVGVLLSQSGTTSVDANGINGKGTIVGHETDHFGTHGYVRSLKETYKTIDYPGAEFTVATAINDSDTIVGYYLVGGVYHGFQDVGGTLTTLDEPGSSFTQIFGINNAGQISGLYSGGDCTIVTCGFVYQNGTFSKIVAPGSISTAVYGISNAGVVVGSYGLGSGVAHGFSESGGVFTDVDVPSADVGTTVVLGANASGELVGYYTKTVPNTLGGSIILGFVKKP